MLCADPENRAWGHGVAGVGTGLGGVCRHPEGTCIRVQRPRVGLERRMWELRRRGRNEAIHQPGATGGTGSWTPGLEVGRAEELTGSSWGQDEKAQCGIQHALGRRETGNTY